MADVVVTVTDSPLSRSVTLTIMSVESGDATGGEYVTMVTIYVYTCTIYMYTCTVYMYMCPSCPSDSHPPLPHTLTYSFIHPYPLPSHTLTHHPPPPHLTPSFSGGRDFTEVDRRIDIISSPYTFSVSIFEDRDVEEDETFSLSLTTDDMGVNIMTDSTVITITDASEYCHIGVGVVCGVMVAGGIQGVLVILMYVYTLGLDRDTGSMQS